MKTLQATLTIFFLLPLVFCSMLKSREISYPSGIVFPLEEEAHIEFGGEIICQMIRRGDSLYFSTRKGIVYCLDGVKRKTVWSFQTSNPLASPVYPGNDRFYIYDVKNVLYCLGIDGQCLWRYQSDENITSAILEHEEHVYWERKRDGLSRSKLRMDFLCGNILFRRLSVPIRLLFRMTSHSGVITGMCIL